MTELLGIKFAPLVVPWHRRRETLIIVFHLFMFFASPFLSIFLCVYLAFYTKYWWLVVLYFGWFIYDFETPRKGARRVGWFRALPIWRYYRDYFPIRLVKTGELAPDRNYIFGCHPHGILSFGAVNVFGTEAADLALAFRGLEFYVCTLKSQFYFPLRREYYMASGAIEVSKESISYVLNQSSQGKVVVIVVGGAAEALDAYPGTYDVTLSNRKGFIKIALQNGAHLVPVVSFGENDLYAQVKHGAGSILRFIQRKLKGIYTYSLPFFYGRGIFNYSFGMLPYRKPINVVVGQPIEVTRIEHPTHEQVDALHQRYKEELLKLFEENKTKYGVDENTRMNII